MVVATYLMVGFGVYVLAQVAAGLKQAEGMCVLSSIGHVQVVAFHWEFM
jgi:hypothetical protein